MGRLREEYRLVCCERDEQQKKREEEDSVMDVDDDANDKDGEEEDKDSQIARLIDELTAAEDALATAQQMLSKAEIEQTRHEIESELLLSSSLGLEDLSTAVESEVSDYLQKWQRSFDLCADTIARLQEELEDGVGFSWRCIISFGRRIGRDRGRSWEGRGRMMIMRGGRRLR